MFGVPLLDHDHRYEYTREWMTLVKRIWQESDAFDHEGRYFQLKHVLGKRKTMARTAPSHQGPDLGRAV